MKKRGKLLVSLAMFAISAAMLVFGVWASGFVTFNVTSELSFVANGVFVGVSGKVLTGTNTNSLTEVFTMDERTNFVEGGNSEGTIEDWRPDNIVLTESLTTVRYYFEFTNYSDFAIKVTPTNNSDTDVNIAVVEDRGEFNVLSCDMFAYDVANYAEFSVDWIAAGAHASYTVTYTLTSFRNPVDIDILINFNIEKSDVTKVLVESIHGDTYIGSSKPTDMQVKLNGEDLELVTQYFDGDGYVYTYVVLDLKKGDSLYLNAGKKEDYSDNLQDQTFRLRWDTGALYLENIKSAFSLTNNNHPKEITINSYIGDLPYAIQLSAEVD